MNHYHSTRNTPDVQEIKLAAAGRELEILQTVAGIDCELLDSRHHPCPKCGGRDRFSVINKTTGAVLCRHCFYEKNGDFIAAVRWMHECGFPEAMSLCADYLGLNSVERQAASHSPEASRMKKHASKKPPFDWSNIVAKYFYTDAKGRTVYKVLRDGRKNFMQGRPGPAKNGGRGHVADEMDMEPQGRGTRTLSIADAAQ